MPRKSTKPAIPIPKLSEFFTNGKPNQFCWEYSYNLSKAVVAKCFIKYLEHFDKEDLYQLATADAVAFTIKLSTLNNYDDIINLRNVLFTRMRNTLSNFIFRSNKLISTEDDILDTQVVYPKTTEISSDIIDADGLCINSIDSFRTVSLKTWMLFKTNGAKQHYAISDSEDELDDWESYSEVKNMKTPCDLISYYNNYTDDQIEVLADKLDAINGSNYFNTLYQLLGDKFLAFLDVFQEDKFNIPSTALVKNMLLDISICEDHNNGLTVEELSTKYNKPVKTVERVISSKDIL